MSGRTLRHGFQKGFVGKACRLGFAKPRGRDSPQGVHVPGRNHVSGQDGPGGVPWRGIGRLGAEGLRQARRLLKGPKGGARAGSVKAVDGSHSKTPGSQGDLQLEDVGVWRMNGRRRGRRGGRGCWQAPNNHGFEDRDADAASRSGPLAARPDVSAPSGKRPRRPYQPAQG